MTTSEIAARYLDLITPDCAFDFDSNKYTNEDCTAVSWFAVDSLPSFIVNEFEMLTGQKVNVLTW